jgi:hypothetical protein
MKSCFLKHYRGSLNVIPWPELQRVSRNWIERAERLKSEILPSLHATLASPAVEWTAEIKTELHGRVDGAKFVDLAVGVWSDPRGRRGHGITIRCGSDRFGTSVSLRGLKEVINVHKTSEELPIIVESIVCNDRLQRTLLNVCKDRSSLNEEAFRRCPALFWIPCRCHFINAMLKLFYESIQNRHGQICPLQQRLQRNGPPVTYLKRINSPIPTIPSHQYCQMV